MSKKRKSAPIDEDDEQVQRILSEATERMKSEKNDIVKKETFDKLKAHVTGEITSEISSSLNLAEKLVQDTLEAIYDKTEKEHCPFPEQSRLFSVKYNKPFKEWQIDLREKMMNILNSKYHPAMDKLKKIFAPKKQKVVHDDDDDGFNTQFIQEAINDFIDEYPNYADDFEILENLKDFLTKEFEELPEKQKIFLSESQQVGKKSFFVKAKKFISDDFEDKKVVEPKKETTQEETNTQELLASQESEKPKSSQETFGLSGMNVESQE